MLQEVLTFKDEILKTVRDYKENLMKNVDSKLNILKERNDKLEKELNDLKENSNKLIDNMASKNIDIEKLKQFDMFKNKADSMLLTHDIRISNNIEEISSIKAKYERVLMDNMLVPGFIGPSCQFKKIGDYIVNNISEVSKLKLERELTKSSLKDMKAKIDSIIKNVINLSETYAKRCNNYTNSQISEIKVLLSQKEQEKNLKEIEIQKSLEKIEKEQNSIKFGEKLDELKNDILSMIDLKFDDFKKNQEEYLSKELNQNKIHNEIYIKDAIDKKLKEIKSTISNIQNKIKKENFPIIPKIKENLMKNQSFVNYIEKLRKGKTNEFLNMNNNNIFGPNKTFSNINNMNKSGENINEMQKKNKNNNNNKSLESLLIEEIEKENKKREEDKKIPDIILKHKDSKIFLLNSNNKEKYMNYNNNNLNEIKSEKNLRKNINNFNINIAKKDLLSEVSENSAFIDKDNKINENINESESSNIQSKKNNKLINDKNNKSNMIISQNNKISFIAQNNLKIEDDDIKNKQKISKENKNNNNKFKMIIKEKILKENKKVSDIIDELKTPDILDKHILSKNELEEMKLNTERKRSLNRRLYFKKNHNKSISAPYKSSNRNNIYFTPNPNKTLKNFRKNLMNKTDKSIKIIRERNKNNNDIYNQNNFELGQDYNSMSGMTIQPNKRYQNNQNDVNEIMNSFNKLYNS